ncbi:MAG: methyltransferase domain-containing protein, partial [Sphingopyxis sp.]|nr:methyltransferase domain-containing protein [Sphingopyxis sp.]
MKPERSRPRETGFEGTCHNAGVVERSAWMHQVAADPGHSQRYLERFRAMARDGRDLAGEARLLDAMAPRGARILDAGCGPGRVGGYLAAAGHQVVGVDVDPVLIEAAKQDHPGPRWLVGDLAELDLPARGITETFQLIVSAGNVMTFLAPSTRIPV